MNKNVFKVVALIALIIAVVGCFMPAAHDGGWVDVGPDGGIAALARERIAILASKDCWWRYGADAIFYSDDLSTQKLALYGDSGNIDSEGALDVATYIQTTGYVSVEDASYFQGDLSDLLGDFTIADNAVITGTLTQTGATATFGDDIADEVRFYGVLRNYDGSDNWRDIDDVNAMTRKTGWHTAYNITGWNGATDFQALFANTQVTDTTASCNVYGIEGKATLKAVVATGTTTAYGVMGKVVAKTTATIPNAYGIYSRVETDGAGDTITSGVNFMADLDESGTHTTDRVLYTEADTWTYGLDLSNATIGTADIVLSQGETIVNTTDGVVATDGQLGFLQWIEDTTASMTLTAAESGKLVINDGVSDMIYVTLPDSAAGLFYGVMAEDDHDIRVEPSVAEQILSCTNAVGDACVLDTQYDAVWLVGTADAWLVVYQIGTPADGD